MFLASQGFNFKPFLFIPLVAQVATDPDTLIDEIICNVNSGGICHMLKKKHEGWFLWLLQFL